MPFKVLIVDDEPDVEVLIRQRFRKQMKDGEFEFVFAQHGVEALECLRQDPSLDIVMTDINMPVMDGLTLLANLSHIDRTLKAVIVSAYGDIQNIRTAMNRGAYDFLTKPIDFHDFEVTLRKTKQELDILKQGLRAREHLLATLDVVRDLSSELELSPFLRKIISTITKMLNAERSTLFLYDEKTDELYTEVGQGLNALEIRMPAGRGIAGAVFRSSQPIRLNDPYSDPRFNQEVDKQSGFLTRSMLCVPVINKQSRTIGVIQVLNRVNGSFTEDDEKRLQTFSSQISIALENAKLFNDVQAIKNYNESILESMSSGVITVNEDGTIVTCNAAAYRILHVAPDYILRQKAEDFFGAANAWFVDKLHQVEKDKTDNVTIDATLRVYGKEIQANVTILPLTHVMQRQSGLLIMIEDITREKRLKSTMSRYVDASVAERLLESDADLLGGQNSLVTVLFSDVRGFARLTEQLGPAETVALLNQLFTAMVDCIQREGGMLDKFIGDALMAEFGIPLSRPDDEDRAVRTAILMQQELRKLNDLRTMNGHHPLSIGIGINTATVISGNIGSPKRMDYTVVGDGVNLASRIERACRQYGSGILIGESTFRRLKGRYQVREVDRVILAGKSDAVNLHEILDYHTEESFPQMKRVLDAFHEGLQLYRQRRWDQAIRAFTTVVEINPDDQCSRKYITRCENLRQSPPPDDWNSVWIMKSK
jgi:adenylate cyclase